MKLLLPLAVAFVSIQAMTAMAMGRAPLPPSNEGPAGFQGNDWAGDYRPLDPHCALFGERGPGLLRITFQVLDSRDPATPALSFSVIDSSGREVHDSSKRTLMINRGAFVSQDSCESDGKIYQTRFTADSHALYETWERVEPGFFCVPTSRVLEAWEYKVAERRGMTRLTYSPPLQGRCEFERVRSY